MTKYARKCFIRHRNRNGVKKCCTVVCCHSMEISESDSFEWDKFMNGHTGISQITVM